MYASRYQIKKLSIKYIIMIFTVKISMYLENSFKFNKPPNSYSKIIGIFFLLKIH